MEQEKRAEQAIVQKRKKIDKAEDRVWKVAIPAFGEEIQIFLGQNGKIKRIAPTEQVHLQVRQLQEDFNFEMEEGYWRHYEFESDRITVADMRRFREYEAYLSMEFQVPVITTVVSTANVEHQRDNLNEGINTYRVESIQMKDKNADEVLKVVWDKLKNGNILAKADVVPVALAPLMAGKSTIYERVIQGFQILKTVSDKLEKEDIKKLQAILYALAVKFLSEEELNKLKEEVGMSYLGQLLVEEGRKEGGMHMLISLVKDGLLNVDEAAKRVNMSAEAFEEKMKLNS